MDNTSAFVDMVNDPFVLVILAVYFLPSIVAAARNVTEVTGCVLGNLFLGWTGLGWFICLGFAFLLPTKEQAAHRQKVRQAKDEFYLRQAEKVTPLN